MRIRGIIIAAFAVLATVGVAAAEPLRIGGTGAALETMRELARIYAGRTPGFSVEVPPSLGSTGAIRAVRAGAIDIGVSGRQFSAAEAEGRLRQLAFAHTPFVFVTSHPTARRLNSADLPLIYGGTRTAWDDGQPIRLILRPQFDSDSDLLVALFGLGPALTQARTRREIAVAATDQDNGEAAQRLAGSLTAMTLLQVTAERLPVRALALDGIEPRLGGGANPSYPYTKTMYLIVRQPPSEPVLDFLAFVAMPEAGAALRAQGALPITPLGTE
jgi:phosphate transport system substrate-binding protein